MNVTLIEHAFHTSLDGVMVDKEQLCECVDWTMWDGVERTAGHLSCTFTTRTILLLHIGDLSHTCHSHAMG